MADSINDKKSNPYASPTSECANTSTRTTPASTGALTSFPKRSHILAASPSVAPIFALCSIIAVVILERDMNVRGAILGSLETPMGILFTFSAYMFMGAIFWMPLGFLLSVVLASKFSGSRVRYLYPTLFLSFCGLFILFLWSDLKGIRTHYLD